MPVYPPKLAVVEETDFGSVWVLTDGSQVRTDVKPRRLAEALADAGRGVLSELVEQRRLAVLPNVLQTDPAEWVIIANAVRTSPVAEGVLGEHPAVWAVFSMPYDLLQAMPHRVYGGLDQGLYTGHPVLFRSDPTRTPEWRRALLNDCGGWVFETWVELGTGRVEVTADVLHGHYLE